MLLIDAEKLRDDIFNDSDYNNDTINHFLDVVDEQPEVDAEPVVHGHWIENPCLYGAFCSRCGENYGIPFNFCPNCGAKMDEEVQND